MGQMNLAPVESKIAIMKSHIIRCNHENSHNSRMSSDSSQVSQVSQRLGNTKTSRARARRWIFTLNNPSVSDVSRLEGFLKKAHKYAWQTEIGEDKKTPHIQGCFAFRNQVSFSTIKRAIPRAHIERCKDWPAAVQYCQKSETRVDGGASATKGVPRSFEIIDFYDEKQATRWQKQIIKIVKGKVDRRKIYWFYSSDGGVGKTTLARHLMLKYDALMVGGKANDILYAVGRHLEEEGYVPPVVINLPRAVGNHCSYKAIESLKDGIGFSAKYESKPLVFNPVHVIVFANSPPDLGKMSGDRWEIHEI